MHHKPKLLTLFLTLSMLINWGRAGEASEQVPQAITVRGDQFRGRLARIDEDWHITFDAGQRRHVLAADDLIRWGGFREQEVGPLLVLADGGILVADREVRVAADQILVSSRRLWEKTSIPLELVRGILYQPSPVPLERDRQLQTILTAKGEMDQLWLANGDRLAGLMRVKEDAPSRDAVQQELVIETAEQSLSVPTGRVVSLVFNPALVRRVQHTGMHAVLGFRDGSRIVVDRVTPKQDRLKLTLSGGVSLESYPDFDAESVWEQIVMIRPNSSRVTYLSDLDPISFKTVPYLEKTLAFRRDRNVRGGQLRAGGILYEKGIGMHSTSRLAYRLSGDDRQFAAELAVDDLAKDRGSVRFRIYVAGPDGKWARALESDIIRGSQPPVPVSVDVADKLAIALIVEFADYGDQLDYANWLNARLVR